MTVLLQRTKIFFVSNALKFVFLIFFSSVSHLKSHLNHLFTRKTTYFASNLSFWLFLQTWKKLRHIKFHDFPWWQIIFFVSRCFIFKNSSFDSIVASINQTQNSHRIRTLLSANKTTALDALVFDVIINKSITKHVQLFNE